MVVLEKKDLSALGDLAMDQWGLVTRHFLDLKSVSLVTSVTRKTVLISVGAFVLAQETLTDLGSRCIDRGATLETETKSYAKRVVNEVLATARLKKAEAKKSVATSSSEGDNSSPAPESAKKEAESMQV